EADHGFHRRSSSPWAKNALALRRISLAWRSSRTSRSSALMRSRSSVVVPGRLPWSRSACRTPFDSGCDVAPILARIDAIAAHCDVCSVRCSNTIRTARSRTSAENFGDFDSFVMAPVSQELEPPANPGRFTFTDIDPLGIAGLFRQAEVDQVISILDEVRRRAA